MPIPRLHPRPYPLSLALALVLLHAPAHLQAQVTGPWANCRPDSLSTYNCGRYYSGTLTLTSELKTPDGTQTRSIGATVTGGQVTCKVKQPDAPMFDGPGMLSVQHANTDKAGEYTIRVWCPQQAGERPSRNDAPSLDTYEQQAADYATLDGKDAHEHPDADSSNGLSGTETLTWHLHR